ncbi:unnamed protein product, partial [Meganyctiphanes norvegica]
VGLVILQRQHREIMDMRFLMSANKTITNKYEPHGPGSTGRFTPDVNKKKTESSLETAGVYKELPSDAFDGGSGPISFTFDPASNNSSDSDQLYEELNTQTMQTFNPNQSDNTFDNLKIPSSLKGPTPTVSTGPSLTGSTSSLSIASESCQKPRSDDEDSTYDYLKPGQPIPVGSLDKIVPEPLYNDLPPPIPCKTNRKVNQSQSFNTPGEQNAQSFNISEEQKMNKVFRGQSFTTNPAFANTMLDLKQKIQQQKKSKIMSETEETDS